VGREHVEAQLLNQASQPGRLAFRQLEDQPGQRGRVDDGMLQRAFQAAPHQPAVEGVVAVLDEHRTLREPKECASRIAELWSADQHRAVDVVALFRVRVDRRPTVDEGVEEGQRTGQLESLGAQLED
jgi:hypothetical protein